MEAMLNRLLKEFKKSEYKIHVLHTSMQGVQFLVYHPFLDEVYNFLGDQIDEIMEMMEQLGYDVPVNLEEIIKDEMEEDTEEELEVEELTEQEPNIIEQLSIVTETLDTLRDVTQDGIMTSGSLNDYVVQNNIIDYQKAVRKFQRKNRRMQGKK